MVLAQLITPRAPQVGFKRPFFNLTVSSISPLVALPQHITTAYIHANPRMSTRIPAVVTGPWSADSSASCLVINHGREAGRRFSGCLGRCVSSGCRVVAVSRSVRLWLLPHSHSFIHSLIHSLRYWPWRLERSGWQPFGALL